MSRRFNTAGPCDPERHYMVPPVPRLPDARDLIDQQGYLGVHAPRQTGKTTTLRSLAQALTAEGRYAALHVTCEEASIAGENYGPAVRAILGAMRTAAEIDLPPELWPPPFPDDVDERLLGAALRAWVHACPRPLVLLLDEIDSLVGQSLILDVRCRDRAGTTFVVKMQLIHLAGYINRGVYDGGKAYADQRKAGEPYTKLTDVVGISICDFELWPDAEQDKQKLPRVPMLSRWFMTESVSDNHRLPENTSGTSRLLQVQYAFLELPKLPKRKPDTGALHWAWLFVHAPKLSEVPDDLPPGPYRGRWHSPMRRRSPGPSSKRIGRSWMRSSKRVSTALPSEPRARPPALPGALPRARPSALPRARPTWSWPSCQRAASR